MSLVELSINNELYYRVDIDNVDELTVTVDGKPFLQTSNAKRAAVRKLFDEVLSHRINYDTEEDEDTHDNDKGSA